MDTRDEMYKMIGWMLADRLCNNEIDRVERIWNRKDIREIIEKGHFSDDDNTWTFEDLQYIDKCCL